MILLYLSTAFFLLNGQREVAASETITVSESSPQQVLPQVRLPEMEIPELPPLGEASKYLPFEDGYRTGTVLDTRLVIKLSERRVYVYQIDEVLVSYPIAVGKAGWETPTGNFQVMQMLQDPAWEHPWTGEIVPPGPDNPLGDRWIGFWTDGENYIGFHGTPAEELVGQAVSHGCIRMRNKDVKALFEKVAVGTPVFVEH
ncbi:MAG: L,D-transpeptidase [Coleofasciculaceae cyanobacterium]